MSARIFEVKGEQLDKVKELVKTDIFARNGYELRNALGLGLDGEKFYLYIDGDNTFWSAVKKNIDALELDELEGETFDKVNSKFKDQLKSTGNAIGALFSS